MNAASRRQFYRRALLGAWALFTIFLLSALALIVRELAREGHAPLAILTPPAAPPAGTAGPGDSTGMMQPSIEISVFFANMDTSALVAEKRFIPGGYSTTEQCRSALDAIIKGPSEGHHRILPETASVRGVYLLGDGLLVADLSRETAMDLRRGTSAEALMAYGIANTLCQPGLKGSDGNVVKAVQFLIEGAAPQGALQDHLDFSRPFAPSTEWIRVESSDEKGAG